MRECLRNLLGCCVQQENTSMLQWSVEKNINNNNSDNDVLYSPASGRTARVYTCERAGAKDKMPL